MKAAVTCHPAHVPPTASLLLQGVVKGLWSELCCLTGWLVQSGQGAAQAAGGHLYTLLFTSGIQTLQPQHAQQVRHLLQMRLWVPDTVATH